MKVDFALHGIRFEWDREKADLNLKKHAISFEAAVEAFLDPFVKSCDAEYRDGEVRNVIIGMAVNWQLLYVAFTIREEDIFRIISARPVTKSERRHYEES